MCWYMYGGICMYEYYDKSNSAAWVQSVYNLYKLCKPQPSVRSINKVEWMTQMVSYDFKVFSYWRTVMDGLQNGGDVDSRRILSRQFPPKWPIFKAVHQYVILWHPAQQRHHPVRRMKESLKCSLQFRLIEHVHERSCEEQHNALAAVEIIKIISMELIGGADCVQQNRSFAEFSGRFQDMLQVWCPFLCLSSVQN